MDSVDCDYQSEAIENEAQLLGLTNQLLEYVGIVSKKVLSIDELVRVGSSLFVAVFESLFHLRVNGIIRSPKNQRDYAVNAQLVIDCLSQHIQMDLKHITGESIVRGDLQSISNLINILFRIVGLTRSASNKSKDSDFPPEVIETFITAPKSFDSISTHESAFHFDDEDDMYARPELPEDLIDSYLHESDNQFSRRSQAVFQLEDKQARAALHRARLNRKRESLYSASNKAKAEKSKKALQSRKVEELKKQEKSHVLQRSSEEHVMLRKIYKGLLSKMHEWKREETRETAERLRQLKAEAELQWRSLDSLFHERVKLLREQEGALAADQDAVLRSQRKMLAELLHSQKQQQDKVTRERLDHLAQRRARKSFHRNEAHKDLIALLSVDKWEDLLRHDSSGSLQRKINNRRPASAPFSSRTSSAFN